MSPKFESVNSSSVRSTSLQNATDISTQNQSVQKYTRLVQGIETQIREINESKLENTNIVAGIGDFIGEKTGAFTTGKDSYRSMIANFSLSAKDLHTQIVAEFPNGKDLSDTEKSEVANLLVRLQKLSGSELKSVGWADAVMNTTGFKDITAYRYYARMTYGLAEGAYEGVAGIADLTGKVIAQLAASLDPKTRAIVIEDYKKIADTITLENAKKLWDTLPQAFAAFKKLPVDQQLEGASKLIGMIVVPLGIGAKGVQAGKAVAEVGMATAKAGVDMTARAANIAVRQAGRVGGASAHAMNVASRAAVAGVASTAMGAGGVALAETGVVAATAVRYVGEMGGGGPSKIPLAKADTFLAKLSNVFTDSGVSAEKVIANANLSDSGRFALTRDLLNRKITDLQMDTLSHINIAVNKGDYQNNLKELGNMAEKLDRAGFTRAESKILLENGILGKANSSLAHLPQEFSLDHLFQAVTPDMLKGKTIEIVRPVVNDSMVSSGSSLSRQGTLSIRADEQGKLIYNGSYGMRNLEKGETQANTILSGDTITSMKPRTGSSGNTEIVITVPGKGDFVFVIDKRVVPLVQLDNSASLVGMSPAKADQISTRMSEAFANSGTSPEVVMRNSRLADPERFALAKDLLGRDLTPSQQNVIQYLHNQVSKGVYQNSPKELRIMVEKLDEAGFSRPEGRKLMENGVLGNANDSMKFLLSTNLLDSKALLELYNFTTDPVILKQIEGVVKDLLSNSNTSHEMAILAGKIRTKSDILGPVDEVTRLLDQLRKDLPSAISMGGIKAEGVDLMLISYSMGARNRGKIGSETTSLSPLNALLDLERGYRMDLSDPTRHLLDRNNEYLSQELIKVQKQIQTLAKKLLDPEIQSLNSFVKAPDPYVRDGVQKMRYYDISNMEDQLQKKFKGDIKVFALDEFNTLDTSPDLSQMRKIINDTYFKQKTGMGLHEFVQTFKI